MFWFVSFQIRLLKEELACKDEQLSHYQNKAAAWKGVTIKNKNAAACSHPSREESSISSSDLKKYEGGSICEALHNGGKFSFAKFNLSHLNRGFSLSPGQLCFICLHHFASPIRLFILPSY